MDDGVLVMVSTDLGSRGLDLGHVEHVVQLEFASNVTKHLHRIGRTARAGRNGRITNIVLPLNSELARRIRALSDEGKEVSPVFSRRRGFTRKIKQNERRAAEEKERESAAAAVHGIDAMEAEIDGLVSDTGKNSVGSAS
mmetsp:Transcript_9179/g.19416  ORF Transcript_9179/g.19416 Transcript_9179/m.19416 type:complete len:140 (+) Transcript_9179:89-508(+)